MRYVKWFLTSVIVALVLSVFHYTLPQVDIVRIVGTENRRIDFGENSFFWAAPDVGTAAGTNRDVFFIQTFRANGRPMVYRNEDTGWHWPPYFKINSSNLQANAANMISTADNPRWVAVRHYGWRNEFFTIFPNAVSMWPVEDENVRIFPWINVVILTTLAGLLLLFWRMWAQFRERTIDPTLDRIGDRVDAAGDRAANAKGRIRRWLDSWRDRSGR